MAEHEIIDPALLRLSETLVSAIRTCDRFGKALAQIALGDDAVSAKIAMKALYWSETDENAALDAAAKHGLDTGSY